MVRTKTLMSVVNRNKIARSIKNYVLHSVIDSYSSMNDVRNTIRKQKGVSNLVPYICESWARGLGFQTIDIELMFASADILQFCIKVLNIKFDEQTDDCLYKYGEYTYVYDQQGIDDFYWKTVGEILCWC